MACRALLSKARYGLSVAAITHSFCGDESWAVAAYSEQPTTGTAQVNEAIRNAAGTPAGHPGRPMRGDGRVR
jgi:hypothetical protein